ncbi:MAG: GTPase (G3E family) [Lachnospiraceae bacterium]|nr:GTPase (G3E family) [Lachnospiraceae bacterium]
MVRIDLITGFLGSGKTTFLLKYARYLMSKGLRIGILEYDYGAVNVDMLLLNKLRGDKCELEMVAAACDEDCLKRRFRTKLIAMAMTGYDRVIVEPSGVFDMDMFFDTLRDDDTLERMYEIGSVITVVNANLKDNGDKEEDFFLASQAASAGCILLSRVQLSGDEAIAGTKAHIERAGEAIGCRIRGKYIAKDWEKLTDGDFEEIERSGYFSNDYMKVIAGKSPEFDSVCFLDLKDGLEGMQKKIKTLFEDESFGNIIRVKGFVCDKEGGYQINATKHEILVDLISIGQGVFIVIGTGLDKNRIREYMYS